MMQLKRVENIRLALALGLMAVLSAGRIWASEPAARPLSVKKNVANSWQVTQATFDAWSVKTTLGQISRLQPVDVPEHGRFLLLSVDGYVTRGEIGRPALPCRIEIIEIPQGATPTVEILRDKVEIVELPMENGKFLPIYPQQPPVSKGSKPAPAFAYDRQVYAAKGYPAQELVRVEIMGESRGVRLAKVIVSPVEYDPARNRLRVHTELAFDIVFEGADQEATQARKQRYSSQGFQMPARLAANAVAMQPKATKAGIAKPEDRPMRYAIVSDPKFKETLQPFIQWKQSQGFEVVAAYTDEENVGRTNTSIRTYLKGLYDNASEQDPAPTYVLLVGDIGEVPPFDSKETDRYYQGHVTDLYFVEYTGDRLPEAYIGRFSATKPEELQPQIDKTMYMSSLTEEQARFVDTTLLIAGNDKDHNFSHLNPALRYIHAYASAEEGVTSLLYLATESSTAEKEDEIIRLMSSGVGLICYTGHGLETQWEQPLISNSVLRTKIFNKGKYPMMIGNCCLTGGFDLPTSACFGEELLRQPDKGAVVYIGATNSSYFDEDFYWAVGLADISSTGNKEYTYNNTGHGAIDYFYHTHGEAYGDWVVTASDMIYQGNMSVELSGSSVPSSYYWEIYELFGDPSYQPYKKKPLPTPLECEAEILVGSSQFSVQTAPYARLTLFNAGGDILATVTADAYGKAEVPANSVGTGAYRLYGLASGYTGHEIDLHAKMPEGPFAFVEHLDVYDGETVVEKGVYGKRYTLSMQIKNIGTETISSLKVQLRSEDDYFEAGEAYTHAEALAVNEVADLNGKLSFTVSPDVPDNYMLHYQVELTPAGVEKPMTRPFSFWVQASDLKLLGLKIDDAVAGNGNGVLDAGETVTVSLQIYNAGMADARNVKTGFSSEKAYLVLPSETADWGSVKSGDTVTREFELGAKHGEHRYDLYTVVCKMDADGRQQEMEATSYIGPVVETFETGDFSFVAWDTVSDWLISDSAAHGGRYCAASARIGDRDTSRLRLRVNVLLDDIVSFYYRTSTEGLNSNSGDFLYFVVDGEYWGRWNRLNDWTFVSFPITAGEHTLEWWYVKDGSAVAGADRVWIDDVRLPIGSHAPLTPNECVSELSAAGEPLFTVIGSATYELNLRFKAIKAGRGRLYLLNMAGENVRTLANDLHLAEGESIHTFSTAGLKPGLYVCVFEGADGRAAVKFIKR